MNAINFLIQEHNHVKQLFEQINSTREEKSKIELFQDLCQDLAIHEKMEQALWYPHFKNCPDLEEIIKHLLVEEKKASEAMMKLVKNINQAQWHNEDFLKFKDDVDHHAAEEEQKLFPKVKNILKSVELEEIGKRLIDFKKENKNSA